MMEFSKNEMVLVEHYGFSHLIESCSLDEISIYRMMVDRAFSTNDMTSYADALRAAWTAIQNGSCYRMTEEFEAMIGICLNESHTNPGKYKVATLCGMLNQIGLKSDMGQCNWADGDNGYCLHVGERTEKLLDGNGKDTGETILDSLFTLSFRSDGTLVDYEDSGIYKSFID
jgi:hypothetical protein